MSAKKYNIEFWFQGTGLTGQNLSEHNQNKFDRVSAKFERKGYGKLSKMRLQRSLISGSDMINP